LSAGRSRNILRAVIFKMEIFITTRWTLLWFIAPVVDLFALLAVMNAENL